MQDGFAAPNCPSRVRFNCTIDALVPVMCVHGLGLTLITEITRAIRLPPAFRAEEIVLRTLLKLRMESILSEAVT